MQVKFEFEKDTPGTRRFQEILGPETDDKNNPVLDANGNPVLRTRGVIGTIYIMKKDLTKSFGKLPDKMTITVTEG